MKNQKPILLVHETDDRHGKFDFAAEGNAAPEDLKQLLNSIESLPWRRRNFEQKAVFAEMERRAKAAIEGDPRNSGSFCPSQNPMMASQAD